MPQQPSSSSQGKTGFASLPDSFFTQAVPKIQDLAELKVVLYAAYIILRKQDQGAGRSEYSIPYKELKTEVLQWSSELSEDMLRQALDSAVKHGALLHSTATIDGMPEDVYSLATPIHGGGEPPSINIFALYEQNIGIITPIIAEELKEAERLYPHRWIEEAFKEAVSLNKRSWRYIARILERWGSEGKDSGEHKRDAKKDGPDKYVKGKYGHLVKR